MNILVYFVAMLGYGLACYWSVRVFFLASSKAFQGISNAVIRSMVLYSLFFLFSFIELPLALFFPAWLSEKMELIERNPATTTFFLAFGVSVLLGAVWLGWHSDDGRRFSEIMRQK